MKYKEGDVVQTRFFYREFTTTSGYKRATIQEVLDEEYGVVFLDTGQHKWINSKNFDRLSKLFNPGSGVSRNFKFLT